MIMKIFLVLISLLSICIYSSAFAKDNHQFTQAKDNFESECVRGIAESVLVKDKVQNHTVQIKNTMDEFSILYGLKTAQLGNG